MPHAQASGAAGAPGIRIVSQAAGGTIMGNFVFQNVLSVRGQTMQGYAIPVIIRVYLASDPDPIRASRAKIFTGKCEYVAIAIFTRISASIKYRKATMRG